MENRFIGEDFDDLLLRTAERLEDFSQGDGKGGFAWIFPFREEVWVVGVLDELAVGPAVKLAINIIQELLFAFALPQRSTVNPWYPAWRGMLCTK